MGGFKKKFLDHHNIPYMKITLYSLAPRLLRSVSDFNLIFADFTALLIEQN